MNTPTLTKAGERTQHTLGPWLTYGQLITADDRTAPGYTVRIATASDLSDNTKGNPEESKANARLIAAAPELLEALRETLEYLFSPPFIALHGDMPAKRAQAAITKAEGK